MLADGDPGCEQFRERRRIAVQVRRAGGDDRPERFTHAPEAAVVEIEDRRVAARESRGIARDLELEWDPSFVEQPRTYGDKRRRSFGADVEVHAHLDALATRARRYVAEGGVEPRGAGGHLLGPADAQGRPGAAVAVDSAAVRNWNAHVKS